MATKRFCDYCKGPATHKVFDGLYEKDACFSCYNEVERINKLYDIKLNILIDEKKLELDNVGKPEFELTDKKWWQIWK